MIKVYLKNFENYRLMYACSSFGTIFIRRKKEAAILKSDFSRNSYQDLEIALSYFVTGEEFQKPITTRQDGKNSEMKVDPRAEIISRGREQR